MEISHPRCLVLHNQCFLPVGVLSSYAGRTTPGMTDLCLDAAHGEHERTGTVAPVCSQCHDTGHVEGGHNLARCADLDVLTNVQTDQRVVDKPHTFAQRCAHVIHQFCGCCARAPFGTVDHNKIRF